jgi:hypothetical protein
MVLPVESSHIAGESQRARRRVSMGSQTLMTLRARRVVHRRERGIAASVVTVALGTVGDVFPTLTLVMGWPGMAGRALLASRVQTRPGRGRPPRAIDRGVRDVACIASRIPDGVCLGERAFGGKPAGLERPRVRGDVAIRDRRGHKPGGSREDRDQAEPDPPSRKAIRSTIVSKLDPRPAPFPGLFDHRTHTRASSHERSVRTHSILGYQHRLVRGISERAQHEQA